LPPTRWNLSSKLANILTILFQPLLDPLYGLLLLIAVPQFYGYNMYAKLLVIGIAIFLMVILPVLWYLLLIKLKVITTPQASDRKQRIWAYLFTLLCYIGTAWFFMKIGSLVVGSVLLMAALALALVTGINFFWKISAHATGISGLLGATLYVGFAYGVYNPPLYVVLIICCGLVSAARLQLEAHTPWQLVAGTILGFSVMFPLPLLIF